MIADIRTMIWKELKEIYSIVMGTKGAKVGIGITFLIFAVFFPINFGADLGSDNPFIMFFAIWLPLVWVSTIIADSFAGERERKTLETLLASRLSDQAILFGKIGAALLYGWCMMVTLYLTSLLVCNLTNLEEAPIFPSLSFFAGTLIMGLLGSLLASAMGVLFSLRATTVKQAQQSMSLVVMGFYFLPFLGGMLLPESWRKPVFETLKTMDAATIVICVIVFLALVNCVLIAAAIARFKRPRLLDNE